MGGRGGGCQRERERVGGGGGEPACHRREDFTIPLAFIVLSFLGAKTTTIATRKAGRKRGRKQRQRKEGRQGRIAQSGKESRNKAKKETRKSMNEGLKKRGEGARRVGRKEGRLGGVRHVTLQRTAKSRTAAPFNEDPSSTRECGRHAVNGQRPQAAATAAAHPASPLER